MLAEPVSGGICNRSCRMDCGRRPDTGLGKAKGEHSDDQEDQGDSLALTGTTASREVRPEIECRDGGKEPMDGGMRKFRTVALT